MNLLLSNSFYLPEEQGAWRSWRLCGYAVVVGHTRIVFRDLDGYLASRQSTNSWSFGRPERNVKKGRIRVAENLAARHKVLCC